MASQKSGIRGRAVLPPDAEKKVIGLMVLSEGRRNARHADRPDWDFAVQKELISELGVSNHDLRWLVAQGLVAHKIETTRAGQNNRCFMQGPGLRWGSRSCLCLTKEGIRRAGGILRKLAFGPLGGDDGAECPPRPRFDVKEDQLWLGNDLVRTFPANAKNQIAILSACEEEEWVDGILDPLPPSGTTDPPKRLRKTLYSLNQSQSAIKFNANGTGEGFNVRVLRPARARQGGEGDGRAHGRSPR